MSLSPVIVSVERPVRVKAAGGGKSESWESVPGLQDLQATQNFYGRTSQLMRLEAATHNAAGPGLEVKKQQLFVFRQQPAPDIRLQDRLVTSDGLRYVVQFPPRLYLTTLQVDAEIVG